MFKLVSEFAPAGDQPEAIAALTRGLESNRHRQILLGVTGSGKTFTMANVIQRVQRPTLVISHNKTLAAQLYGEFKAFFHENAVEFFISYYDYYLPEAYIPQTDTYIAKDASINEDIERLRISATSALVERRDVIVVASVSCIYGLGSPEDFEMMSVALSVGQTADRRTFLGGLTTIQYERNDDAPGSGQFRVRGDVVDVFSPYKEEFTRVEFWDDEVVKLSRHEALSGRQLATAEKTVFFPVKNFVMPKERLAKAEAGIMDECLERVKYFEDKGLLVEAQRIYQRTTYDLEMLREIGYCSGIENYSRHLAGRPAGSRPYCLIDFFPKDFLVFIDESHVSIPQVRGMYRADRSRKETLVEHGFRLPSALDNRPLCFDEFDTLVGDAIFVSATPGDYETTLCGGELVEQVVRPTGLLDPVVELRPLEGQVDDLVEEIRRRAAKNERTLVTTLTKKSSEKLADYLQELGLRVKYLHSEIDAIQRVELLCALRRSEFDCLVGINLLREGLDLPEVSLVAILDADKEGFLRSERSLIQTAGRAARNVEGTVILYADVVTESMRKVIETTARRRKKQLAYNQAHGIVPQTIVHGIRESLMSYAGGASKERGARAADLREEYGGSTTELVAALEKEMFAAAAALEFERAAMIRDRITSLKDEDTLAADLSTDLKKMSRATPQPPPARPPKGRFQRGKKR